MPWLDELAALSADGLPSERFYRAQALLFAVLDVIVPRLSVTEHRVTATLRCLSGVEAASSVRGLAEGGPSRGGHVAW